MNPAAIARVIAILTISSGVVAASAVSGVPKLFPAETEWASASNWGTGAGMSVRYRDAWESAYPDDPGHTFTPGESGCER